MVFSSNIFLFVFLPCVIVLCVLFRKHQNTVLLISSLFFYFWGGPNYLLIMLASIAINYVSGIWINYAEVKNRLVIKKFILFLSIIANLGMLFYFKYLDFSIEIVNKIFKQNFVLKNIVLPIGISFFTFQGMSYVIDLYRKKVCVQRNITKLALYISFFPQLIAGPIVRYKDINDQIENRNMSLEYFSSGVIRFMKGLGKKVLIANTVALTADNIFNAELYSKLSVGTLWLGIICYTIQIYFDFSGYSDMAIGLGKMFGFDFLENFNYPYIAKSITEFWRRWHISLSSFFRDYLYIPLGGNRRGNVYLHLLIVFFATGIWHGASLNFVLWGMWHGFFIVIERVFTREKQINIKVPNVLKHLYTLGVVMMGWVLFRCDSLERAFEYLKCLFAGVSGNTATISAGYYLDSYLAVILIAGITLSTPILSKVYELIKEKSNYKVLQYVQLVIFTVFCLIVFMKVMTSTYNPFIYFRF